MYSYRSFDIVGVVTIGICDEFHFPWLFGLFPNTLLLTWYTSDALDATDWQADEN